MACPKNFANFSVYCILILLMTLYILNFYLSNAITKICFIEELYPLKFLSYNQNS